jgi:hypothetical protein
MQRSVSLIRNKRSKEPTMYEFIATAPICAVLDIPAARIQVIAADRDDVTVEVLPGDASQSRDVKAAERVEVTFDDGILRVISAKNSSPLLGSSGSVEITVRAPAESGIRATTASGEFRGVGRLGEVTFEGASGSVKIDEPATSASAGSAAPPTSPPRRVT